MTPSSFVVKSSRPSVLHKTDQGHVVELVDAIASTLVKDFNLDVRTVGNACSSADGNGVQNTEKVGQLVCMGASILKQAATVLQSRGFDVCDLSVPGWQLTPERVAEVAK